MNETFDPLSPGLRMWSDDDGWLNEEGDGAGPVRVGCRPEALLVPLLMTPEDQVATATAGRLRQVAGAGMALMDVEAIRRHALRLTASAHHADDEMRDRSTASLMTMLDELRTRSERRLRGD